MRSLHFLQTHDLKQFFNTQIPITALNSLLQDWRDWFHAEYSSIENPKRALFYCVRCTGTDARLGGLELGRCSSWHLWMPLAPAHDPCFLIFFRRPLAASCAFCPLWHALSSRLKWNYLFCLIFEVSKTNNAISRKLFYILFIFFSNTK